MIDEPFGGRHRCRREIATASVLIAKWTDIRRRVLADPKFAGEMLNDMISRDLVDPYELCRPDRKLPSMGELLVQRVIDPMIALYKGSLSIALRRLTAAKEAPVGRRVPVARGRVSGRSRSRGRRRQSRSRASPARPDGDDEPPPDLDGLTPLQRLQRAYAGVLYDARADLDERAMAVFVDFACAAIAREAQRVINWREGVGGS